MVSDIKKRATLTEFGGQLDHFISRLNERMTITDYAELTGLSYKYISQLRTKSDRRPGSYATIRLLKPFVDFKVLTPKEALKFSKITRGKTLTLSECKELFPTTSEKDLRQAINEVFQSEYQTVFEPQETIIIENDYCVPITITEFIKQENPQVVKMIDYSAQYGRNYINEIRNLDPHIKQIQLLIHNPLVKPVSDLQKKRACEQIRTLKLIDFKSDILKIKCYNRPASLRGIKFDEELILLGWYTYYFDPNYPEYGKFQIWGHTNPMILSRLRNQGKFLGDMFNIDFNSLWNDPDSASILDVCTNQCPLYQARGKSSISDKKCTVSEDWLKKVSD